MLLFSINFNSYYLILKGKLKDALNTEVKVFLIIFVIATSIITLDVYLNNTLYAPSGELMEQNFGSSLKHSAFTVATIISTSGFGTVDFAQWSAMAHFILITLVFTGACAGSTAGAFKLSRIIILFKSMLRELFSVGIAAK
jgi:trk system potassium uptake protein TrkH